MKETRLPRLLFKVDYVFDTGRDSIIEAGSRNADLDIGYRSGDQVELRRPDGSRLQVQSALVHYSIAVSALSDPGYRKPVGLSFSGFMKDDIPIGTEVWMLVDHPIPLKGRHFEYVGVQEAQDKAGQDGGQKEPGSK